MENNDLVGFFVLVFFGIVFLANMMKVKGNCKGNCQVEKAKAKKEQEKKAKAKKEQEKKAFFAKVEEQEKKDYEEFLLFKKMMKGQK